MSEDDKSTNDDSVEEKAAPGSDSASPDSSVPSKPRSSPAEVHGVEEIPDEIPILPVRSSVAFPGTIVPLSVGREKSKKLIEHAVDSDNMIGVVSQREEDTEDPQLDDLYRIGTVCVILKLLRTPDGTLNIIVHGLTRLGIEAITQQEPYLVARINAHEDSLEATPEIDALVHNVREATRRVFNLSQNVPDEATIILDNIDTPGELADFISANISIGTVNRQELLETFDVAVRLRKINTALVEQIDVLELSNKIQSQVRAQIDKSQREYYLQEQLKAIQKELGEVDSRTSEIQKFEERIEQAKMPEPAQREAERELERMQRIPQASPEYSLSVDYLTWLCDLPWVIRTEDILDLARAERILNKDHYGLEKVKKRVLEFLAVRKLNPAGRGPILCFLGPPGVGKTSLGQSIARALGRKFIRISLGGLHDEAQLRGHRRTYIGAMPGRIVQEIRKAGSCNPVFMLDEVDKIGQDFRGDPASALLEVLDPEQNHTFTDNYLDVSFDLSHVMFIATANTHDPIPPPLRDRMELIRLNGYTISEKVHIARRYLVPRQLSENGLTRKQLNFNAPSLRKIATVYTREAGVRDMERQIAAVARGVASQVAKGRKQPVKMMPDRLSDYLGPERFDSEIAQATSIPGVVTGLAFTPAGGEILFIEAARMPGKGRLTLTGQIGDVMKESAQAAFSIVRSRASQFRIDPAELTQSDMHVHVPAGAIPKDGPSAGVSMLTAIVSLFTGRPCKADVAMTGEITLSGRVLAIGGIKEKVLAAHRAGIQRVILPADNRKDLSDLPADVRKKMKFTFAEDIDRVLRVALMPARLRAKN